MPRFGYGEPHHRVTAVKNGSATHLTKYRRIADKETKGDAVPCGTCTPPLGNRLCRASSRARSCGTGQEQREVPATLAPPARCVEALWQPFEDQGRDRLAAGDQWEEDGIVFSSAVGKPLDAVDVRRTLSRTLTGSTPKSGHPGSPGTASCPCSRKAVVTRMDRQTEQARQLLT